MLDTCGGILVYPVGVSDIITLTLECLAILVLGVVMPSQKRELGADSIRIYKCMTSIIYDIGWKIFEWISDEIIASGGDQCIFI